MKKFLILFVFLIFFFQNLHSQNINRNLSNSIGWDGEPYVAVNPADPNNIVIAWMSYQPPLRIGIEVKYSNDAGLNWSATQFLPHFSSTYSSADVSMAFSNSGDLFLL